MKEYEDEFKPYYESSNEWTFAQIFGDHTSHLDVFSGGCMEDWITALSFDTSGKYLGVGHFNGSVFVLKYNEDEQLYGLYTDFKSHEPAFDCLISMEIEERINIIKWFPFSNRRSQQLLTCNDKTIKLFNLCDQPKNPQRGGAKVERVFDGGHVYNINGLSFSSDGETFISSDDLRINLWHMDVNHETFNIIDIKPENLDDITEVITASNLNPVDNNQLVYGTNNGLLRLSDLRDSARCTSYKIYGDVGTSFAGFFGDFVSSVSDVQFSPCGRFLASRDYLSVRIWDCRYEKGPIQRININQHLVNRLYDLYENECIFDKFNFSWSPNSSHILTGSYNNTLYSCEAFGNRVEKIVALSPGQAYDSEFNPTDPYRKILKVDWNPKFNSIMLSMGSNGFIYNRKE